MPCTITVTHKPDMRVHQVDIVRTGSQPHLLMVTNRKGTLRHVSKAMAAVLGLGGAGAAGGAAGPDPAGGPAAGGGITDALDPAAAALLAAAEVNNLATLLASGLRLQDFMPTPWRYIHNSAFRVSA